MLGEDPFKDYMILVKAKQPKNPSTKGGRVNQTTQETESQEHQNEKNRAICELITTLVAGGHRCKDEEEAEQGTILSHIFWRDSEKKPNKKKAVVP